MKKFPKKYPCNDKVSFVFRKTEFPTKNWKCFTLRDEKPVMASAEEMALESVNGKQLKWCHLVISKPRGSLLTNPSLSELEAMLFEHFLHEDLPDFAYSATILTEADDIATKTVHRRNRVEIWLFLYKNLRLGFKFLGLWTWATLMEEKIGDISIGHWNSKSTLYYKLKLRENFINNRLITAHF